MAKTTTRSARRAAKRSTAPVVETPTLTADQAEKVTLAIETTPDEIAADLAPEQVRDETIEIDASKSERPTESELAEVLGEPIATIEPEAQASESAPSEPPAPDAPSSTSGSPVVDSEKAEDAPVDESLMLASEFDSALEASAFATNMRLRAYSIATVNGRYRILPRKSGKSEAREAPTSTPTPAAKPDRAKRAKASAPREGTRNAVIWAMLSRPEGTTKKEVDAALAAFQPDNIQPCGIGSDAKLFSSRFGYDWRKEQDGDATRYFCFPFVLEAAPESEVASEPEAPASEQPEAPASDASANSAA